jgi:uncharacterized protein with von Willebrand factor type A (vWA) domain
VLESFFDFVAEAEILPEDNLAEVKASDEDRSDIELGIQVEILNATLGLDAGYRAALETDEQFLAAIDHLPEGRDFWSVWKTANLD